MAAAAAVANREGETNAMAGNDARENAQLIVPLREENYDLTLNVEDVPEDFGDLMAVLMAERASPGVWLDVAYAYLQRGAFAEHEGVLTMAARNFGRADSMPLGSAAGADAAAKAAERAHLLYAVSFATYRQMRTRPVTDKRRQEDAIRGEGYLNAAARRLPQTEKVVDVARGAVKLTRGSPVEALTHFANATLGASCRVLGSESVAGYVGQGIAHLAAGAYEQGLSAFRAAVSKNPACPPLVRVGLGACAYGLGRYILARRAFCRALAMDPDCIPAMTAMASLEATLAGLEVNRGAAEEVVEIRTHRSLEWLTRAYDADPTHPPTLLLMALHKHITGDVESCEALCAAAVRACGESARPALAADAACLLARCKHAAGDFAAAEKHYKHACDLAQPLLQELKSSNSRGGRGSGTGANAPLPTSLLHAALPATMGLMHYGLAQMHIHRGDFAGAAANLEKALASHPYGVRCVHTLFGSVAAALGKSSSAIEHLRESLRDVSGPERTAPLERLGEVLALSGDYPAADEAYASSSAAAPSDAAPRDLVHMNNVAVLEMRRGAIEVALRQLKQAREMCRGLGAAGGEAAVLYNLALAHAAARDEKSSAALVDELLALAPWYAEAHLVSAHLARQRFMLVESKACCERALSADKECAEARAMLADVLMTARCWPEAKQHLDELKASSSFEKHGFADTALGILNLNTAPPDLPPSKRSVARGGPKERASEDEQRRESHITRALEHFKRALQPSKSGGGGPRNAYAAIGVGCCLAMRERFPDAREAFSLVSEAAAAEKTAAGEAVSGGGAAERGEAGAGASYAGRLSAAEANSWVNMAHVHLANSEKGAARRMYERYLEVHGGGVDDEVLLCLARTLHDEGDLHGTIRCLRRALHLRPGDLRLRFDLAFELQECGYKTLVKYGGEGTESGKQLEEKRKLTPDEALKAVKEGKTMVQQAARMFAQLNVVASGDDDATREALRLGLDGRKMGAHVGFCINLLENQVAAYIQRAEEAAMEYGMKLEEERAREATVKARAEEDRKANEEKDRIAKQEHEALARQAAERMKRARIGITAFSGGDVDDKAAEKASGKKPEKRQRVVDDDDDAKMDSEKAAPAPEDLAALRKAGLEDSDEDD